MSTLNIESRLDIIQIISTKAKVSNFVIYLIKRTKMRQDKNIAKGNFHMYSILKDNLLHIESDWIVDSLVEYVKLNYIIDEAQANNIYYYMTNNENNRKFLQLFYVDILYGEYHLLHSNLSNAYSRKYNQFSYNIIGKTNNTSYELASIPFYLDGITKICGTETLRYVYDIERQAKSELVCFGYKKCQDYWMDNNANISIRSFSI